MCSQLPYIKEVCCPHNCNVHIMLTDSSKYDYDDVDEEDGRNNDEAMI